MSEFSTICKVASSVALASASALHVLWGSGSSWPWRDRETLAAEVAGTDRMPSGQACFAVAAILAGSASVVAGLGGNGDFARLARAGIAAALLTRGVTGLTGRTELLVSWTPSEQFVRLDRRRYGPLCLVTGALVAAGSVRQ